MSSKIENVQRRIALLLERANHPSTPPAEAESCRSKADTLMFEYQIDAALVAEKQPEQDKPFWSEVLVCRADSEWGNYYAHLVRAVAEHVGVKGVMKYGSTTGEDGYRWYTFDTVGFQGDVDMFTLLWTQTMMEFQRRFEPKYDRSMSDAVNAFLMRMSGMERRRIAAVMFPGWTTTNEMKARTRKVTKLIKEGAEELGEDVDHILGRQGASIKTFRLSYASGFVYTLENRMRRLRSERGADERGLVLVSRKERVLEALYEKYPRLRPAPAGTKAIGEERASCDKCAKAKSGYCREHMWMKPSSAQGRARPFSGAAYSRGSDAARQVDLGPGGRSRMGGTQGHKAIGG